MNFRRVFWFCRVFTFVRTTVSISCGVRHFYNRILGDRMLITEISASGIGRTVISTTD